jgi:hypothetical protein
VPCDGHTNTLTLVLYMNAIGIMRTFSAASLPRKLPEWQASAKGKRQVSHGSWLIHPAEFAGC